MVQGGVPRPEKLPNVGMGLGESDTRTASRAPGAGCGIIKEMETRREYQARYMRKYRLNNPAYKERERERDRERKKVKRRTDPEWLSRERARRREYGKYRNERNKEKQAKNHKDYVNKNRHKENARRAVRVAIKNGSLKRPKFCQICHRLPKRIGREKQLVRADHYRGYGRKNWLVVRWICISCDGKLNRAKNSLVTI